MLVELSVMEQRYHAVMEVLSGAPVTEVARRHGVSRQAVHLWLGKYRKEGLAGLADHSHRPRFQPRQLNADIEALICQLRGAHPRWGPRRLTFELGKANARAVCRAFIAAMRTYGIPDEVLTDNGKQFTGRFGKPRPAEVLFERICRRNGIR